MKFKIIILFSVLLIFSSCGLNQSEKNIQISMLSQPQTTVLYKNTKSETKWLTTSTASSENDLYESIVKNKIAELLKSAESEQLLNNNCYAFCDIDGNGSEELLFGSKKILWGYESGFLSQAPVEKIVLDQLYTTIDQKVQEIIYQPTWRWNNYFAESLGGRDILSNGIIRYYGGTSDYISYAYFRYSNGELEFIKALMSYEIAGTWAVVDNQGNDLREKISKDEFERMRAEIEDGAEVVELDWHPLIEYGK